MHPGRLRAVWFALFACAVAAYVGILIEGHGARAAVVDTVVYGATLTGDGRDPVNTAFLVNDGSAAIGVNYRIPSSVRWTIVPLRANASARRWLYLMAEDPQFFAANGAVNIFVDATRVGVVSAASQDGGRFVAQPHAEQLQMPPAPVFGYRFLLTDQHLCYKTQCDVTVRGAWVFWHVYRIAIIGETPRFSRSEAP